MEETACLPLLVRRRDVGEPFLDLESRAWVPWGLQLPPENWEQKPRNNNEGIHTVLGLWSPFYVYYVSKLLLGCESSQILKETNKQNQSMPWYFLFLKKGEGRHKRHGFPRWSWPSAERVSAEGWVRPWNLECGRADNSPGAGLRWRASLYH